MEGRASRAVLAAIVLGLCGSVALIRPDGDAAQASIVVGGSRIASTGWACTAGFQARDVASGQSYVLTAGHCLKGSGLLALWSMDGTDIGRAAFEDLHAGTDADVGGIAVSEAGRETVVRASASGDIPVAGSVPNVEQSVGTRVCRAGGSSGWGCGTIAATDVTAWIHGTLIRHTWWTDFPSAPGDSGSPVIDATGQAAGMLIATTATQSIYSTVDWIASEAHLQLCLGTTCDRPVDVPATDGPGPSGSPPGCARRGYDDPGVGC
jgi:hypothetical protein